MLLFPDSAKLSMRYRDKLCIDHQEKHHFAKGATASISAIGQSMIDRYASLPYQDK